jgi:hypothetical protein
MALILPNIEDAPSFDGMSVRDAADFQTLAAAGRGTGVISGMAITQDSGTDLDIASAVGVVKVNGIRYTYAGTGSPFTVPAVSVSDRRDAVVYRAGTGVVIIEGTPCGTANWNAAMAANAPVKPPLVEATDCLLGEIYTTPTTTAIVTATNIVDKRVILNQPGGLGTPDQATVAMTASTLVMVPGTKIAIPTGSLSVGSRFRFMVGIGKTSPGTATWALTVRYGTNGTTADAAIATFTSTAPTVGIDAGIVIIEVTITALGSGTAATAKCMSFYSHSQISTVGFAALPVVPGSTAGFNSNATSPFMHVDITAGASYVMTAWGSAEQLV